MGNITPTERMSGEQVRGLFSTNMQSLWDAGCACLNNPTEASMTAFRALCRPAEIMTIMREYAEKRSTPHVDL